MLVIKLQGGLGNQMFQYAFGLTLSQKLNSLLFFDLSFYKPGNHNLTERNFELNHFPVSINIANDELVNKFLRPTRIQRIVNKYNIKRTNVYRENTLKFNRGIFDVKQPIYVEGFWQSDRYFSQHEKLIRKSFIFKESLNQESQKVADILTDQSNTVSVHVRRGDYINSKATNELHGICSLGYYKQAMALINKRRDSPHFYFFSDDTEWVKDNLVSNVKNYTLVQHNTGPDSWQDMALMSRCKHHIIANSSFSWWGAWLNPSQQKIVIAPAHWFAKKTDYYDDRDIVPWNWIRMSNK